MRGSVCKPLTSDRETASSACRPGGLCATRLHESKTWEGGREGEGIHARRAAGRNGRESSYRVGKTNRLSNRIPLLYLHLLIINL